MKTKKTFNKILTSLIVVVTFCLMISLADLFSSLITVGGFTFVSDDVSISKFDVYAVCISSHQTLIQAQDNANICISLGGAGYIYADDEYYVIASIYENEADAQKVKESLTLTRPSTTIKKIEIGSISMSSNLSSQEKSTLTETFNIFKNTYKKLYDISVSLDTGVIQEINARLSVNELASTINEAKDNFSTVFSTTTTKNLLATKKAVDDLSTAITNLVNNAKVPYTSYIKYAYCETLMTYKNLADTI